MWVSSSRNRYHVNTKLVIQLAVIDPLAHLINSECELSSIHAFMVYKVWDVYSACKEHDSTTVVFCVLAIFVIRQLRMYSKSLRACMLAHR